MLEEKKHLASWSRRKTGEVNLTNCSSLSVNYNCIFSFSAKNSRHFFFLVFRLPKIAKRKEKVRKGNIPFLPTWFCAAVLYKTRGYNVIKRGITSHCQHLSLFLAAADAACFISLFFYSILNRSEVTNCKRKRPYAVALSPPRRTPLACP